MGKFEGLTDRRYEAVIIELKVVECILAKHQGAADQLFSSD